MPDKLLQVHTVTSKLLHAGLIWLALAFLAPPVTAQSFERTAGIIGILPLPEVLGSGPCARFEPRDVPIFRAPAGKRRIGRVYVARYWTFPKEGGCEGLDVRVRTTEPVSQPEELPTMEFGYEKPGAIVLRRTDSWFEIALPEGTGWVQISDAGRFLPVEQLFKDRLLYLRKGASIPLQRRPGDPVARNNPGTPTTLDLPIELRAFKRVAGRLWVEVEPLAASPCTQEGLPVAPAAGWVRFHDAKGEPSVWFSSRGC